MRRWWLLVLVAGCKRDEPTGTPHVTTGETTPPFDGDHDGYAAGDDCDDLDPAVNPGADERCDGIDTDCDPTTREPEGMVGRSDGGDHATIAEAVAAAGEGATVWICGGTRRENVVIDKDLTLIGLGEVTIDAGGAGPGVTITAGTVSLSGFGVVDGVGSPEGPFGSNGGGIDAYGASGPLAVSDVTVSGCEADIGGGILVGPAGGALTDVVVEGSTAHDHGGGVYATGPLTLTRVTLSDNVAGSYGGGLAFGGDGDRAVLEDVVVERNAARLGGGLFTFEGGRFTLTDTVVRDNTADGGGGVYLWTGELKGGDIDGNHALEQGGGVVVYEGGAVDGANVHGCDAPTGAGLYLGGAVQLLGTVVADNVAAVAGGGATLVEATVGADAATEVRDDVAAERGGGLYLVDSTWTGGTIATNDAQDGGGVYVSGTGQGSSTVSGATISGNQAATSGGGLFAGGPYALQDLVVEDNVSQSRGGGMYTTAATGTVDRTTFARNVATERGGALYPNTGSEITLRDSELRANLSARGAGIYVFGASSVTLTRCVVEANGDASTVSGGGARVTDGLLASDATSWGDGATDNAPDDLYVEIGQTAFTGYGADETFDCDATSCTPAP